MRSFPKIMAAMSVVCASACLTSLSPPGPVAPSRCDLKDPSACTCNADSDCGNTPFFFCSLTTSKCVPTCTTNDHCNNRPGGFELSQCSGALGCWCDQGECLAAQCSTDAECSDGVCRDGQCTTAPQPVDVARCAVTPDFAVVSPGESVTFAALATRADGTPVVLREGASWVATTTALAGEAQLGHEATFHGGATTPQPTPSVRASFGAVSCEAKVLVLPEPSSAYERIVSVIDERTGRPVPSAVVIVSRDDGTIVPQSGLTSLETNPHGFVKVTVPAGEARTLSVFHADYGYQTLARVPQAPGVLRFALERNPTDLYGGYRATFDAMPVNSNVQLARAGLSSGFDLTGLRLTDEGEPTTRVTARIGSAIEFIDTPVPLGTMTAFATTPIKPTVAAAGVNGVCVDRDGNAAELQIAAGLCGTQSAWALTADVGLGQFPIDLAYSDGFSFLPVLERLELKHLGSSVQRDVQFTLSPPTLDATGVPDLTDVSRFLQITHTFDQVPLGYAFVARAPKLPQFRGEYLDRALTAGVALQPGRGAVPIGVGTALNVSPFDEALDGKPWLAPNQFEVRMAPRHHGLEAASYALVSQVRSTRFPTLGRASSTLITRLDALRFDPDGANVVDQSTTPFLSLAEGGRFDLRTRTFTLPMRTDATLVRVSFTDARGRQWHVLTDPTVPAFTLPALPPAIADRVLRDPQSGTPSLLTVQTQRFDEPAGSDRLVQFAEWVTRPELHDPLRFMTAWSMVEQKAPAVRFTDPARDGLTFNPAPTFSLAIEGVHLGQRADDHLLQLRFVGGIQCPNALVSDELSPGLVQVALPMSCRGMNMTLEAELLDQQLQPLSPAVVARVVATVN